MRHEIGGSFVLLKEFLLTIVVLPFARSRSFESARTLRYTLHIQANRRLYNQVLFCMDEQNQHLRAASRKMDRGWVLFIIIDKGS